MSLEQSDKEALGMLNEAALGATYTCTFPNCQEPIHVVARGCQNESAVVVEARKIGSVQSVLIDYIKENPTLIQL